MELRRATDEGNWFARVGARIAKAWRFVDESDLDNHAVSIFIMYGTYEITRWAMHYAETSTRPGLEVAAIVAAVFGPYSLLQGAAIKWYFDVRNPGGSG